MSEVKEILVNIIMEEEISSIQIISRRLGISEDKVRELLDELIGDGNLIGYISKDDQRFFRHDLKQPNRTSKALDEYVPSSIDIRLSILVLVIGIILLAVGSLFYDPILSGLFSIITVIGLVMCLTGAYYINFRRSSI